MGDPPSYDPYLLEAARVLNNTDAKVKHIVFLGDGDAIYEANQGAMAANIKKIRDMGITVSTITTGARQPAEHQVHGDDRLYRRRPILRRGEASGPAAAAAQGSADHQPAADHRGAVQRGAGRWRRGVQGRRLGLAPPLLGYNISDIKPTAEMSLLSHRQDPIFAGWRYGLGRSVAFTSDDRAKWGAQWLAWPGYAKFWAQAVRWTLRPFAPSDYNTQVTMDGPRGHIVVDAFDEQGHYVNKLHVPGRVAPPYTGGMKSPPSS